MELLGFFTDKGLAYSAKVFSGAASLTITRAEAGSGQTLPSADTLEAVQQTLSVGSVQRKATGSCLPVTLVSASAEGTYSLQEIGIYAQDPDEGEILYKVYCLPETFEISPTSSLTLRFYLEDSIFSADDVSVSCSPAGILTETDMASVLAKAVPTEAFSLSASELQAYLDSLPRLLTKHLRITVSGTLDQELQMVGFYGSGSFTFIGNGFTLTAGAFLSNCKLTVSFSGVTFTSATNPSYVLRCLECRRVCVELSSFSGNNSNTAIYAFGICGIYVYNCSMKNFNPVVRALQHAQVNIVGKSASDFSNNSIGAAVSYGAVVSLSDYAPSTLGGTSNSKNGGYVISASGTLL